jgi:ArsR family transcriptional regulator, arsenate/arsenite/antimonite-responsive transcriptional repressor
VTKSILPGTVAAYKALAHPARVRLLLMLRGGALCVCQMTATLDLATSTVSAHLAELRRAGLVRESKDGRFVSYELSVSPEHAGLLQDLWRRVASDPVVRADARLLRELRRVGAEELCRAEADLGRLGIRRPEGSAARA